MVDRDPYYAKLFNPNDWPKISADIFRLNQEAFHYAPQAPLLNAKYRIIYPDLEAALHSPDNMAVLLHKQGQPKAYGYSLIIPSEQMFPDQGRREGDWYVYFTALEKSIRGQGLVAVLSDGLVGEVLRRGGKILERDAVTSNGYAGEIVEHFGDTVLEARDHEGYQQIEINGHIVPATGPEKYIKIDLLSYAAKRNLRP